MKLIDAFRRRRLLVLVVVLSCASFAAIGIWGVKARPDATTADAKTSSQSEQGNTQQRLRNGVANEIRFVNVGDSDDDIRASVDSLARLIHARANLMMSDDTRNALQNAEKETLAGTRPRISVESLADSFTKIAGDQLGRLTDTQIEHAANGFRGVSEGQISPRMSGKWGLLSKEEFTKQVKEARDRKQRGDSAVERSLRPFVAEEVDDRIAKFSEAMPDKFGNVRKDGVTPIQAVLIGYSVVADDNLADSPTDLSERIVRTQTH